jgi:hypothetical protein
MRFEVFGLYQLLSECDRLRSLIANLVPQLTCLFGSLNQGVADSPSVPWPAALWFRFSFRSDGSGDVVTYSCERAAMRGGDRLEAVALNGLASERAT